MKRLESNNWAAPRKFPGETISSPVEKTADANTATHFDSRQPQRRGKRNILRSHPSACRQSRCACGKVFSYRTDIGACLQPQRQDDVAPGVEADVLLHEYRVGAKRHRRASKNANGAPWRDGLDCSSACLNPTDDGKRPRGASREISTADGVTINGGIREGRQGQRRRDVRSKNTTIGASEIDGLNVLHWSNLRGQNRNRVIHWHQLSTKGKAIVRQLGHLLLWFLSR